MGLVFFQTYKLPNKQSAIQVGKYTCPMDDVA